MQSKGPWSASGFEMSIGMKSMPRSLASSMNDGTMKASIFLAGFNTNPRSSSFPMHGSWKFKSATSKMTTSSDLLCGRSMVRSSWVAVMYPRFYPLLWGFLGSCGFDPCHRHIDSCVVAIAAGWVCPGLPASTRSISPTRKIPTEARIETLTSQLGNLVKVCSDFIMNLNCTDSHFAYESEICEFYCEFEICEFHCESKICEFHCESEICEFHCVSPKSSRSSLDID
ncbi:hypothetical protein LXL04_010904 [Taraxacum kok-saghyz]